MWINSEWLVTLGTDAFVRASRLGFLLDLTSNKRQSFVTRWAVVFLLAC